MTKENLTIWGREFSLPIEYEYYKGEPVLPGQHKALEKFLSSGMEIDKALDAVKHFCLKNYREKIKEEQIGNIFKYVMPAYLFVERDTRRNIVNLMCHDRFAPDNGIAVVFVDEKFVKVCTQDDIL